MTLHIHSIASRHHLHFRQVRRKPLRLSTIDTPFFGDKNRQFKALTFVVS